MCPCSWTHPEVKEGLYYFASLDDFNEKIRSTMLNVFEKKNLIFIIGNSGVGKTHLAISTLKAFSFYDRKSIKIAFQHDFTDIHTNVDLLLIDEFDNSKDILQLINNRLSKGKQTICTTNLPMDTIDDRYSWRGKFINLSSTIDHNLIDQKLAEKEKLYNEWYNSIEFNNQMDLLKCIES